MIVEIINIFIHHLVLVGCICKGTVTNSLQHLLCLSSRSIVDFVISFSEE
ncbi:Uncharacterised protein [Segatella copri]|nr:Uncharacterised protein [Segatella copri]